MDDFKTVSIIVILGLAVKTTFTAIAKDVSPITGNQYACR